MDEFCIRVKLAIVSSDPRCCSTAPRQARSLTLRSPKKGFPYRTKSDSMNVGRDSPKTRLKVSQSHPQSPPPVSAGPEIKIVAWF